jgi:endonuclease YncB( thermonuclease family)
MRRGLLVLAGALLAATLAADTAAARRASCAEGTKRPLCTFQAARAVFVADGDTIWVRLAAGAMENWPSH